MRRGDGASRSKHLCLLLRVDRRSGFRSEDPPIGLPIQLVSSGDGPPFLATTREDERGDGQGRQRSRDTWAGPDRTLARRGARPRSRASQVLTRRASGPVMVWISTSDRGRASARLTSTSRGPSRSRLTTKTLTRRRVVDPRRRGHVRGSRHARCASSARCRCRRSTGTSSATGPARLRVQLERVVRRLEQQVVRRGRSSGAMTFTSWARLAIRTERAWRMKALRCIATTSASARS